MPTYPANLCAIHCGGAASHSSEFFLRHAHIFNGHHWFVHESTAAAGSDLFRPQPTDW
jgi:hypothetical protein